MNKVNKYTILTVFLALAFTFGSMAGTHFILRERERQFLTEKGRVVVEVPIRSWQEQRYEEKEETEEKFEQEGYALTIGQMEEVIRYWEGSREIIVHHPVNGQISMEKAIQAGEEWLAEMGMGQPGQIINAEAYSVNATLGVAMQDAAAGVQLEPYYSFWTVQFAGQSMSAALYLNAVTGKVWDAEIVLYDDPEQIPYEQLKRFAEAAGLQVSDAEVIKNQDGIRAGLQIGESELWAAMEFWHAQTEYPDGSHYEEKGLAEYQGEVPDKKNAVLHFRLTVDQYGK